MNPVLLKPEGDGRSQVVLLGRAIGSLPVAAYHAKQFDLRAVIRDALDRLRAAHDLVVIEGAGSPAEVNLKEHDVANMFVARLADAPVVLVGDIDRGGVFAALVGTMELLDPDERARVGAFLINKFRGDARLLDSGLAFLERRTGVPVLGVLPYVHRLQIPDEDSVALDDRSPSRSGHGDVAIAIVRLPHIANFDDFHPLEHEPGVCVRYVEDVDAIAGVDLLVLPGTKTTVRDLEWLRGTGLADAIRARARRGEPVLGVCGGCQMLGGRILDPGGVESDARSAEGLGLLPLRTEFGAEKRTAQVRARAMRSTFLVDAGEEVAGFEIHMGRVVPEAEPSPLFAIVTRNGTSVAALDGPFDGTVDAAGAVVGTLLHGLFDNASVRGRLVGALRERRQLAPRTIAEPADPFDRLADVLRHSVRLDLLDALVARSRTY